MALPKIAPSLLPVVTTTNNIDFVVSLMGRPLANFTSRSSANTFKRKVAGLCRWVGPALSVYSGAWLTAWSEWLAAASADDGKYRPPLSVTF
jgi:hypothetical protein